MINKKKRGIPKGYTYQGFEVLCQLCGRTFKTPQALSGHNRFKHSGPLASFGPRKVDSRAGSIERGPGPASAAGNKGLENEVAQLELQEKLANLRARQTSKVRLPDLSEQAGLGPFRDEVAAEVQARAFAVRDQTAKAGVDWLGLLNSPNLPAILQLLRSGLGGSASGSGLEVLKDLGINLKDLLAQSSAPKAGEGLTIAGISLAGAALTPDLLKSVLEFRAAEEKVKADFEGRAQMATSLERLAELLAPHLPGLFPGDGPGRAAGIGAGPRTREPKRFGIECPTCGCLNEVPPNQEPGGTIQCQGTIDGEPCSASWVATEPAQERKRQPITKVQVPEPAKSVPCDGCGQMLNIEGKALGSEAVCPICQRTMTLWNPDIPLEPEEPLTPEQKRLKLEVPGYLRGPGQVRFGP